MSQNLSKNLTNISIFSKVLTDEIFEDLRFVQLMELLTKQKELYKYTYCFFCDYSDLKDSLFVPIFHTSYLSSKINNVLIKDSDDVWVTKVFPHNNFYILKTHTIDNFNYGEYNINIIDNIKEIGLAS